MKSALLNKNNALCKLKLGYAGGVHMFEATTFGMHLHTHHGQVYHRL